MEQLDSLVYRFFAPKSIWGVNINFDENNKCSINAILLEQKKDFLIIKERLVLSRVDDLKNKVFDGVPICISYDSPIVLTRLLNECNNDLVAEELFLTDIDDFKIQSTILENGFFVSVIRNSDLESIEKQLRVFNLDIINLVLGPISFISCLDYVDMRNDSNNFQVNSYMFELNERSVVQIEKVNKSNKAGIKIGEEFLNQEELLPYCNALSIYLHAGNPPYLRQRISILNAVDFAYQSFLNKLIPFCLGLLLLFLLGNFLLLQNYKSKQRSLSYAYIEHQRSFKELVDLKQQFKDYKLLLGQMKRSNNVSFAYYSDQIGSSLKKRGLLSSLIIHPWIEDGIGNDKHLILDKNVIVVKGTCKSPIELSAWIRDLKALNFIVEISKQSYTYDDYKNIGCFSFIIKTK
ncbi:MAG: hypothetical protein N4A74_19095 [Carboxylicivirga sp.]|jgi:hypothetical protein|nr:hypothetical protein [Carboxylicivirga sp.]